MKYLRGRNAVEDLAYEIPTSRYVADMLPDAERGYALAVKRDGGAWMNAFEATCVAVCMDEDETPEE